MSAPKKTPIKLVYADGRTFDWWLWEGQDDMVVYDEFEEPEELQNFNKLHPGFHRTPPFYKRWFEPSKDDPTIYHQVAEIVTQPVYSSYVAYGERSRLYTPIATWPPNEDGQ